MLQAFSKSTRAAVDPNAKGGDYYGPDGFVEAGRYPVLVPSSKASHNEADARQLWGAEALTGVHFRIVTDIHP
jgi:hypothetical protein